MKHIKFILFASACLWFVTSASTAQQLKVPAPSPLQTIDQSFALSNIKIEYARPSVKGRTIFGDLVPYGKIWRTGANASSKITFGEDVKIEGQPLVAGTYALYTIPNKDSWDILFYKDLKLGGNVNDYKPAEEALRVNVKPSSLSNKVETFTINIADMTSNTANIELLWDKTRVAFNVTSEIEAKIMKNIEDVIVKDTRPYYQAATYYYDNNKDMAKAAEWAGKAAEINPKAYWVHHLKAKIHLKMQDNKTAIASAEQSLALAREAKDDTYIKMNEKLIEEARRAN